MWIGCTTDKRKIFFFLSTLLHAFFARADEALLLDKLEVTATRINLIGIADSASQGVVPADRIANVPLLRPGEVLEQTPGLIVSQHSGTGKANQYYLRGFNLDHGTDFAVWLEGMPVNMPTHAHGQGYADTNFLIPELMDRIEFRKGPYFADEGDFSSAGATRLYYARKLPQTIAQLGWGEGGFRRVLLAGSPEATGGQMTYALEAHGYDGPWDSPENLGKVNGLLRWSSGNAEYGFDLLAMAYLAHWDSTDQIPSRSIRSGQIGRYGALDTTDGGETHRYSLSADWRNGLWQANAYAIDYKLDLFSNFTFFLDDPVNGDQFEQFDRRRVYGGSLARRWEMELAGRPLEQSVGLQARYDDIGKVGLYHTAARQRLGTVRQDKVEQSGVALWWQANWQATERLRAALGLRADRYDFDVDSDNPLNSGRADDSIVSPKLGLAWRAGRDTDIYLNWGQGFHSNDGRGSVISVNPADGSPADKVAPLVRATGKEIGLRGAWLPTWHTTLALFRLDIDSELLFVGDAGATEASRPSRREGVEWTNHYRPWNWLYLDADFAMSRARFTDADTAGNRIPGAVEQTASICLAVEREQGWFGSARLRYFGPRPLIEDDSGRSASSVLVNGRVGCRYDRNLTIALDILNLFNRKVADIDYYYESRLAGEAAPVADIHTHPAEPRTLRFSVQISY